MINHADFVEIKLTNTGIRYVNALGAMQATNTPIVNGWMRVRFNSLMQYFPVECWRLGQQVPFTELRPSKPTETLYHDAF